MMRQELDFRAVDALTGDVAESPVPAILAAADEISGQAAECERLREENAELRTRVQELEAENAELQRARDWLDPMVTMLSCERDDLAERLHSLDEAHQITLSRLASARNERDTLRMAVTR